MTDEEKSFVYKMFLDKANRKYDRVHGPDGELKGYPRDWYVAWYMFAHQKQISDLEKQFEEENS